MNTISVSLENCYGIRKLKHEFVFTDGCKTFSIYSPNGMMKTSLAKTFDDFSKGQESKDLVFPDRETKRKIEKSEGELRPEEIFVIPSYEKDFHSSKISTLLVNRELRERYEEIHATIDRKKDELLTDLKSYSGLNNEEASKEISKVFMQNQENKLFEALESIKTRIDDKEEDFKDIKYSIIFSERSLAFFRDLGAQENIAEYVGKYNKLIEQSTYFKKGIFNHTQAEEVAKQLDKNGFFKAEHSVLLKDDQNRISTQKDLTQVIENEKNRILENAELQKMFTNLDDKLRKHKELRDLREYLSGHNYILSQLTNVESFKAKVWLSYLRQAEKLYKLLIEAYGDAKKEIEEITKKAQEEKTEWLKVVEIFNQRFYVPFKITVKNKIEVMLGDEIPAISFEFNEQDQTQKIERNDLLNVLSQGEKKALYILNIIFEVEARKNDQQETLFIIDDIADSFDYKNKYAIIEYLRDISKESFFYQVVLTHNFDFHRTISSRLDMPRSNKLNTLKSNDCLQIVVEKYQSNPFNDWRDNLSEPRKLLASIPFVRNLAEFSGDQESYEKLTSFLHVKNDTCSLTLEDLKTIFQKILTSGTDRINEKGKTFMSLLEETSLAIEKENNDNMGLEDKITLAIAIRLLAEQFIIYQEIDANNINKNQTYKLVEKYKEQHPDAKENIETLEKVLLMTPENIHVNSFMYEPIIDMSAHHLINLYSEIKKMASPERE